MHLLRTWQSYYLRPWLSIWYLLNAYYRKHERISLKPNSNKWKNNLGSLNIKEIYFIRKCVISAYVAINSKTYILSLVLQLFYMRYFDFDKSERKKFIVVSEIRYRPQDYGLVKERPIQTCHFLLSKSASKRPDRKKNCIIYRHYN